MQFGLEEFGAAFGHGDLVTFSSTKTKPAGFAHGGPNETLTQLLYCQPFQKCLQRIRGQAPGRPGCHRRGLRASNRSCRSAQSMPANAPRDGCRTDPPPRRAFLRPLITSAIWPSPDRIDDVRAASCTFFTVHCRQRDRGLPVPQATSVKPTLVQDARHLRHFRFVAILDRENTLSVVGKRVPAASCDFFERFGGNCCSRRPSLPPVDFISGPRMVSTPGTC